MDSEEAQDSPIMKYNKNIVKDYIKNSKVTCCALVVVLLMFIV